MNKFKILLAIQLKEKLNLTFLHSKKQTLFKTVFALLGFFAVLALSYLIFYLCQILNLFSVSMFIPLSLMTLLLFVIIMFNIITCTVGLSKFLFYAKDNQTIITLPVNLNQIYISKMLVYYIGEIKRAFSFVIPIFYAYGIISKLPFIFFIWSPIMLALISAIPVLIGGLLAIPMMFVIAFLKKFPIIKFIVLVVSLVAIVIAVIKLINLIPFNIDLISSWRTVSRWVRKILAWCTTNLSPFYYTCIFLCGKHSFYSNQFFTFYSWSVLLSIIGIIAFLTLLNYIVSRPIYLKLTSKQFEFKRKEIATPKFNLPKGKFYSNSIYETKKIIRDVSILSNTVLTLIVAPITILLLNKIYAAINTRLLGDYLTVVFNILIISLFALSHNIKVASIYSKDGNALIIGKSKPTTPFLTMFPRLMYNFFTTAIIIITSIVSFTWLSPIRWFEGIYLTIGLIFVAFAHILWCADIDFVKPQVALFRTEGGEANNPNEIKATILTFAISAVYAAITLLLMIKTANYVWIKICLVGLAFFLIRFYLFYKKIKLLYKEM